MGWIGIVFFGLIERGCFCLGYVQYQCRNVILNGLASDKVIAGLSIVRAEAISISPRFGPAIAGRSLSGGIPRVDDGISFSRRPWFYTAQSRF